MSKIALITGITGQDGSYLSELLLSKGSSGNNSAESFKKSVFLHSKDSVEFIILSHSKHSEK